MTAIPRFGTVGRAFTPEFTFATPGDLSVAYSTQLGSYCVLGDLVYVTVAMTASTFTHTTASGALQITGLPFASASEPLFVGTVFASNLTFGAGRTMLTCQVPAGEAYMNLVLSGTGIAAATVTIAHATTGSALSIRASVMYAR